MAAVAAPGAAAGRRGGHGGLKGQPGEAGDLVLDAQGRAQDVVDVLLQACTQQTTPRCCSAQTACLSPDQTAVLVTGGCKQEVKRGQSFSLVPKLG